ncbi:MAG: 50S ribosomal protein L29 [Chloroflexota bacterium]
MAEKISKLRELSYGELQRRLEDAQEELMNLRFQQATGELTDTSRLRITRRQIARLLTLMGEQEQKTSTEGEA